MPRVGYRFAGAVSSTDGHDEGVDAAEARPLIAVLPFGIVSEEPGKDYLADGITDDIITALARYRWFRVVVRGSAFALRDNVDRCRESRAPARRSLRAPWERALIRPSACASRRN